MYYFIDSIGNQRHNLLKVLYHFHSFHVECVSPTMSFNDVLAPHHKVIYHKLPCKEACLFLFSPLPKFQMQIMLAEEEEEVILTK